MKPKSKIQLERQWELYRRSVAEQMPESEYKIAVLAAIAHALMRLDAMEAGSRPADAEVVRAGMDGKRVS